MQLFDCQQQTAGETIREVVYVLSIWLLDYYNQSFGLRQCSGFANIKPSKFQILDNTPQNQWLQCTKQNNAERCCLLSPATPVMHIHHIGKHIGTPKSQMSGVWCGGAGQAFLVRPQWLILQKLSAPMVQRFHKHNFSEEMKPLNVNYLTFQYFWHYSVYK